MKIKYNRWLAKRFPTGKVPFVFRMVPLYSDLLLIEFRIKFSFQGVIEALKKFSVNSEGAQKAMKERLQQYAELHANNEVKTND